MKTVLKSTIARGALGIALLAAPAAALAQDNDTETQEEAGETQGRTIVVTGSLIRGTPEDTALPVDIFTSEDLTAEGLTSPLDFIKDIPAVGGVVGDSNQFQVQGLGAVGTINLRGLGPQRTLVLLNGRRTIVSPGDGLVDTNMIPIFALERIELLKDGAAVTYGSDAVAGVANFITRTNFEGVEVQGDYRFIDDSDGDWTASIVGGVNLGSDVNVMAGFGYRHRSPLAAFDRDFSNLPPNINPSPYSGVVNPAQYIPALRTTGPIRGGDPSNIRVAPFGTAGATTLLLGGGVQDVGCEELGGFIQDGVQAPANNGRCFYAYTDFNNLVEESNFYQAYGALNADLDNETRFSVDVLYAFSEQFTRLSPSYPATQSPKGPGLTFPFFVPSSNPGYQTFLDQTGATFNPAANGVVTTLYRPFALGGFPLSDEYPYGNESVSENESYRISAGLERDIGDNFTASLYGTYIDATSRAAVQDTIGVRLQNALDGLGGPDCDVATGTPGQGNCYYFNPFSNAIAGNPVTGQLNPFYIGPDADDPRTNNNRADVIDFFTEPAAANRQNERQYVVDLLFSGMVNDIGIGLGAQYRKSEFELTPTVFSSSVDYPCQQLDDTDCPFPLGPFIFQGPLNPSATTQDVYALFGEVQVPVTDQLELSFALRFEDYGDPIGSTLDPKASFRYEANDWLVMRGSVGTTFRAPLAGQVLPGIQFTNLTGIDAAGGFFFPVDRIGNPELGPESAFTYNLGFVVNTGGFNLTVDYFNYEFEGPLASMPENPIASAVYSGPGGGADCSSPLAGLIVFSGGTCVDGATASTSLARVLTQFVNGPTVTTNGFDVEADYTFFTGDLALTLGTAFTWTLNYDVDDFVINGVTVVDAYDATGFLNTNRAQASSPELKANTYLNANVGGFNARYTFRYASGLTDDRYLSDPTFDDFTTYGRDIDAFTQHDLTVLYDLPFEFAEIQLQGSVENIFDEDPPRTRQVLGYDPFVGNPLGRVFRVGLRAKF